MTDLTELIRSIPEGSPAHEPSGAPPGMGLTTVTLSPGRLAVRRFLRHRLAVASLIILSIIVLICILSPITARYSVLTQVPGLGDFKPPQRAAWFGTDRAGRDLYSRMVYGGRVSIFIGVMVALASSLVGTTVGAIAGYRGGLIDNILMRITDLFLAFPLLVALLVMRNMFAEVSWLEWLFGDIKSVRFMVVLLSMIAWMPTARVVRGVVLQLKEREFVEAARALGATDRRIVIRHLIPNSLGPIVVAMTTTVAIAILTESTLSFFGYGVSASIGQTSWGNLLTDSRGVIQAGFWWVSLFPALALVVTVLCINFIGDGLRDAFDPKQQRMRA